MPWAHLWSAVGPTFRESLESLGKIPLDSPHLPPSLGHSVSGSEKTECASKASFLIHLLHYLVMVTPNISQRSKCLLVQSLSDLFCPPPVFNSHSVLITRGPEGLSLVSLTSPAFSFQSAPNVSGKFSLSILLLCLSLFDYNFGSKWRLWKELSGWWKLAWRLGPFRILNHQARQHWANIIIIIINYYYYYYCHYYCILVLTWFCLLCSLMNPPSSSAPLGKKANLILFGPRRG